ncbi:hypothetical protein D3C80_2226310 [compost metagenome]
MLMIVDLAVQHPALAFERIQALLQGCALELAHHFLEGAPRVPIAAPEIPVENRLYPA